MKNNIPKLFFLSLLLLCFIVFNTCTKLEKAMLVSTGDVTNIFTNTADAPGLIIDLGDGATQHGHCYATTPNVTIESSKTEIGIPAGTGGFTSQLTNLTAGTKYYIKAYITNGTETAYGSETSFTTVSASIPTLTTTAIASVTTTTASSGGNISNDGGAPVTARGVCWNTATSPTTANSKTTDGTGTGSFTSSLTSLTANTTYYYRAYATNSAGTGYGNEIIFTTVASTPTLTTTAPGSITQTTATSGGNITDNGGAPVLASGVCWSTTSNPLVSGSHTTDGSASGTFISSITGLTANTTYYVKAYATNIAGTAYGNELSFITNAVVVLVPTLTTASIGSVTSTSATCIGDITSDGGATVSDRGVCWSTTSNPTLANNIKSSGTTGTGNFANVVTGLTRNTTYYIRAYATNSAGTAYGDALTFTTNADLPVLTTSTVSSITSTTALSGGGVTSDGGAAITAVGVCWSITAGPTISGSKTTDGTGTGTFTSSITGLSLGATYFVRAYAINSAGTGYGNEVSFSTTLTIGESYQGGIVAYILQSGDPGYAAGQTRGLIAAPSDQSSTAYWGCMGTAISGADGTAIGTGNQNTRDIMASCSTAGTAAKLCNDLILNDYSDWYLPGKDELGKLYINRAAIGGMTGLSYWSSSEFSANIAWKLYFNDGSWSSGDYKDITGASVRAIRAFPAVPVLPAVSTTAASAITSTTASGGGNILSDGGAAVTSSGVCWNITPGPTTSGNKTTDGTASGTFISPISSLTPNTIYYVRAYATNSAGTVYGSDQIFRTAPVEIGASYQGGIMAYILQPGDPGYIAGQTHGLIAAPSDQSTGAVWGCKGTTIPGAGGTEIGTGNENTIDIMNGCSTAGIAARLCGDLEIGVYSDWYLPSNVELNKLYLNRVAIGGFDLSDIYSSSTQLNNDLAWSLYFADSGIWSNLKTNPAHVRAVRSF
jgi:hypothetical protein